MPSVTLVEQDTITCQNGVARARTIEILPFRSGSNALVRWIDVDCAASTVLREAGISYSGDSQSPLAADAAMQRIPQGAFLADLATWICGGPPQADGGPTYTDLNIAFKEIEARLEKLTNPSG